MVSYNFGKSHEERIMENQEPSSHSELLQSRWNDILSRCYTSPPRLQPDEGKRGSELIKEIKAEANESTRRFENHEMSREEVLHHLCGLREKEHRENIALSFDKICFLLEL
jgi:hypothetical protein